MTLVQHLQHRVEKYLSYRRTRHALQTLPLDVALDLDIYRGDAAKIASRAVYG